MTNGHAGQDRMRRGNHLLFWDRLLELQTELFLPYELAFYFSSPKWLAAESVLDVGCGNGHYVARLKTYFPQKRFWGIDCSDEMISIASAVHGTEDIRFSKADFYEFNSGGGFDVVLLRLVLQHLQGFERAMERAAELLRPGGCLIVLEPDPSAFVTVPAMPSLMRLLNLVEEAAKSKRINRARLTGLGSLLEEMPGWELERACHSILPAISRQQRIKLQQMFLLWTDIIEGAQEIDFPFDEARSEIETWARTDVAYSQIGFQIVAMNEAAGARRLGRASGEGSLVGATAGAI